MASAQTLSPELALLCACDFATDDDLAGSAERLTGTRLDWTRFTGLALDHGLGAMAGARLEALLPGRLPADLAEELTDEQRRAAALNLVQSAEAARLTAVFDQADIRAIVLKGTALAQLLYAPQPEWRVASDIDLLIDPADLDGADRLLKELGYRRQWPRDDPPAQGRDMFLHLANVFDYVHPVSGQLVELHYRPLLNPHWVPASFDTLHAASVEVATPGGKVRGLDGPWLVAYLCWHALNHYGFRLKWFADIARALDRARAASCAELVAAGNLGLAMAPFELTDAVLALTGHRDGHRNRTRLPRRWLGHANRIVRDMEAPNDLPTSRSLRRLPGEAAQLLFMSRLGASLPAIGYQWLRTAVDPRDAVALGLGRGFTPVYLAAGPALAVWRLLRRPGANQ